MMGSRSLGTGEMAETAESANMTYRLTFVGVEGVAPVAFVYPTGAAAFTGPVGWFLLRPFQELPRCPSGDIYRFDAPLAADRPVAATAPDGTRVVSAGDATVLRDAQFPLFAERGPGLLEHPELTSAATWRQADSHSPLTVAEWEHLLTRQQRTARRYIVAAVVLVAVLVTLIVIAAVAGHPLGRGGGGGGGGGGLGGPAAVGAGSVALYLRARRSLRTLRATRDRRGGPRRPGFVRVWWSTGDGWGPVAMVSAADRIKPGTGEVIGHAPVVNLRPGQLGAGWVAAELVMDSSTGDWTGITVIDDLELWPTDPASRILPSRWRRFRRSRPQ